MSRRAALASSLLAASLFFATLAHASEAEHVRATAGWIRLLPGNLPAGGYVTLENNGDAPVSLRDAHSHAYASVMLHKSSSEGGMNRMAMVENMPIPAHGKAELSPGGYHLMLMEPTSPVKVGDALKVTLRFADGSTLDSDFIVRPASALGPSG